MAALNSTDVYNLQSSVNLLLDPIFNQHYLGLNRADVGSLLATHPSCKLDVPFTVTWCDPRLMKLTQDGGVSITFFEENKHADTPRDPDFVEKITSWVIEHREHVRRKALCNKVVSELNELCSRPEQMRFLWPTLHLLTKKHDDLRKLELRIREFRPVSAPSAYPGLRDAMKEATAILTMAAMYEEPPVPRTTERSQVCISCTASYDFYEFGMRFSGRA